MHVIKVDNSTKYSIFPAQNGFYRAKNMNVQPQALFIIFSFYYFIRCNMVHHLLGK